MRTAVVTGATSGIGLSIARRLLDSGYRVHGIGRDFEKTGIRNSGFIRWQCDLTDSSALEKVVQTILKEEQNKIDVLINNAGLAYFAPHEELTWTQIEKMIDTNLKAPLLLCNAFLRSLRKKEGFIINIASITGELISRWGGTYGASKAGLIHFGKNLFEDIRKNGVKVVTVIPDLTDTPFYNHLNFSPGEDADAHMDPETVADAVLNILNQPRGTVITQLTIRPQKHQIDKKKRK